MKTKITSFVMMTLLCIYFTNANAQNIFPPSGAAGIGTTTPSASSLLEIKSTSKGVLIPRMTKAKRDSIASPATGLLIYQTNNTPGFYYYSGSAWTPVAQSSSSNGWSLTGNAGTNSSVNFIGTTDAQPLIFRVKNKRTGSLTTNGNIFWGMLSGNSNKGYSNIAIGAQALYTNTTGSESIAIGDSALFYNDNDYHNIAIGSKALYNNTSGYYNVAVGYQALYSNTASGYNTATGYQALFENTGGSYDNTATGFQAMYANSSGSRNTADGVWSLLNNTTGSNNVASGVYALEQNSLGNDNDAHGFYALFYNNGYSNVAMGTHALFSSTEGHNLVAIGDSALYSQAVGSFYVNTAVGSKALYSNTSGFSNSAFGFEALKLNSTSTYNTGLGGYALTSNTTGSGNTGVGLSSLYYNSTGSYNTALGLSSLTSSQTGNYNTALGAYSNVNSDGISNASALGYNAVATASNQVMLGNTSVTSVIAAGSFVIYSDGRYKKDIKDNVPGLAFINQLKPVTYHYDIHGLNDKIGVKQPQGKNASAHPANDQDKISEAAINAKEKKLYTGFVAQDVEAAAKKLNYDFSGVYTPQSDKDVYGLSYAEFVVPLVKSVQELSKMNDDKNTKIDSLQKQNADLQKQFNDLKNLVLSIQQKQDACTPCSALLASPGFKTTTAIDGASLDQNSPNPFNHSTTINYSLPQKFNEAHLIITDKNGNALKTISVSGSGRGSVQIEAGAFASGVYAYTLVIDGKLIATKQMVLTK